MAEGTVLLQQWAAVHGVCVCESPAVWPVIILQDQFFFFLENIV